MQLARVFDIYQTILRRLPKHYPRPSGLIFYETVDLLDLDYYRTETETCTYGAIDTESLTLMLPLNVETVHGDMVSIDRLTDGHLRFVLLHELGHIYMQYRYGKGAPEIDDEARCDRFARRWIRRMKNEGHW